MTPVIGLPACVRDFRGQPYHSVGHKYIAAIVQAVPGLPLTIPALGPDTDIPALLDLLDGLLVTGSPSNVEPWHYEGVASAPGTLHDPHRDATTLPLIRAAITAGVPLLAVCRGIQELNVACGGTLHQRVQEVAGLDDHREPADATLARQYAPAHTVTLASGGFLAGLADDGDIEASGPAGPVIRVNSLHAQGLDRLAPGLVVEATAPDGLVEGVRVADAPGFAMGVQWHPEWRVTENPFSMKLFAAFGRAARARRAARQTGSISKQPALKLQN